MSNKRELKKDINTLSELVIFDALDLSAKLKKEEDRDAILDLIVETANLHNNLISRVNHPDGKDNPKLVKRYFQTIRKDLLDGCDKAYNELNKIIQQ